MTLYPNRAIAAGEKVSRRRSEDKTILQSHPHMTEVTVPGFCRPSSVARK